MRAEKGAASEEKKEGLSFKHRRESFWSRSNTSALVGGRLFRGQKSTAKKRERVPGEEDGVPPKGRSLTYGGGRGSRGGAIFLKRRDLFEQNARSL